MYVGIDLSIAFPLLIVPTPSVSTEPTLYMHPYQYAAPYTNPGHAMGPVWPSNDDYALGGTHPSTQKVGTLGYPDNTLLEADDKRQTQPFVFADQAYTKKTLYEALGLTYAPTPETYPLAANFSDISMVPATGTVSYEASLAGTGVHWAFSTCEWLTACDKTGAKTESVGSKCTVTRDAQTLTGFCFESSTGSLECGRLIETTDKYNTATQMTDSLQRCPRGLAATSIGTWVGKRLLMGGCMLANDANYTKHAEVHVPQLCYLPYDYKKGCMFPGATNYDPQAIQPGNCHYNIAGCTDSTAVNYNSEAYTDDGSCIAVVSGCTVKSSTTSYTGVDTDTPDYQTRYFGRANRAIGLVTQTAYAAVLNYNSNANVNHGCVVAIEGCMDSLAVNYDAHANVNTATWCVPRVEGCMMPAASGASAAFDGGEARPHERDGLAANFAADATVHDGTLCIVARVGCMAASAHNFEPRATVPGPCYARVWGCLDTDGTNFNCSSMYNDDGAPISGPCTSTATYPPQRVTDHDVSICFAGSAPPQASGGDQPNDSVQAIRVVMIMAGSVDDFGASRQAQLLLAYQTTLGLAAGSSTTLAVSAGSVQCTFETAVASRAGYDSVAAAVASSFATLGVISAALDVQALGLPVVSAVNEHPDEDDAPVIAGGAVGGIAGGLLLCGVALAVRRRRRRAGGKYLVTTVVPVAPAPSSSTVK